MNTNAPDHEGPEALFLALTGLFTRSRFLSFTQDFVNFTPKGKRIVKPHQFYAVKRHGATTSPSSGRCAPGW
ncbi:hypothetical protein ACIBF6_37305 [Streptosporangium amethystogenes]|uniref:hypothetical protein n=1 Tax=Streptosporangium amethystogenes TaxID=2002 RepID=UPI0037B78BD7